MDKTYGALARIKATTPKYTNNCGAHLYTLASKEINADFTKECHW